MRQTPTSFIGNPEPADTGPIDFFDVRRLEAGAFRRSRRTHLAKPGASRGRKFAVAVALILGVSGGAIVHLSHLSHLLNG